MPQVITHNPENFSKIMEVIEDFQEKHETSWYRGVGNDKHTLTPSIFRHPKHK